MEIISGGDHQLFFAAEAEMAPFPEVVATRTTDVDFASSSDNNNQTTASEMMTVMMNRPPPAKKLRPIRRSPEPTAQNMSIHDGLEILGLDPVRPIPTHDSLEDEFGSSSDDEFDDGNGGDSSMSIKENRKRKRKSSKKIERVMKSLVRKVLQKQEQMHQQLIDVMQQREKERNLREEEWRKHEMERIKRDEEMRAQEISRNKALISIVQNLLGVQIEIPQPLTSVPPSDVERRKSKQQQLRDLTSSSADQMNKRWPDAEIQALITLRASLEQKFRQMGPKPSIWDEISVGMQNMGYNRTAKKCKEKWENINKYFRKTVENGKKPHENGKTCPYFHELSMLYKNGVLSGSPLNHTNDENVAKIERP
ncbi:trihelix transcription factor GT-2-like [Rutidosis leptorrhynchoides]|uniref:trihelix transcription factor GT-2-like n=1 Tax=Rutidosis leptorrhynchoides TaxID=125765 RepID=UPI003A9924F3